MIHRSFASVVLVATFVSVVTVVSFRWFRFGVSGFSTCSHGYFFRFVKFDHACVCKYCEARIPAT